MIDGADRSISPLMIRKVMVSATMIFSIDRMNRLIWLSIVR